VPAFFVATEDGKGGDEPDSVIVEVPGLPAGLAQCSAWAGDGSHRVPMMQRANQIPALDSVRIRVQPGAEEPPADEPAEEEPPADGPADGEEPPADGPDDGEEPPADGPADENPPAGNPGGGQPPADQPGGEPGGGSGGESPGPEPDQEERPGNGPGSDEQKPGPEESGDGTARPAPVATEPAREEPVANDTDIAEGPPARDTDAAGSGGGLALTGSNTIAVILAGATLFLAGMALVYLTRRRRAVRR
jgi:LPXTG-motif cell wall-anchored protein